MFDGKFRRSVDATTAPVGRWLVRMGFSADVLTGSGLVFAVRHGLGYRRRSAPLGASSY